MAAGKPRRRYDTEFDRGISSRDMAMKVYRDTFKALAK